MRHFPNWIEAYLHYTRHSEAPEEFHYWTAVSAIAGAARRRVHFDMGYFRWYPNFFIMFVGPPGIVTKSTTANVGMSLLRAVDGIRFGPSAVTWQALVTAFAEAREDFPLADGVSYEPMCAVTVVSSELGNLFQPGDQSIINLLTELWDCSDDPFQKSTKKEGTETIVNPWLNFLCCTTPAWIAENFSTYFIGGGFASRTLFVYSEHKRQLVAYPHERLDGERASTRKQLIEDLGQIAESSGQFLLTPKARDWGVDWYERHNSSDNPLRGDTRFSGYFARKQTHLHKTAMVLSLARGGFPKISEEDLQNADRAVTALERNMLSIYGEMNKESIVEQQAAILGLIRGRGSVTKSACYHAFMTSMGFNTFNDALSALLQSSLVELRQVGQEVHLVYNPETERRLLNAKRSEVGGGDRRADALGSEPSAGPNPTTGPN